MAFLMFELGISGLVILIALHVMNLIAIFLQAFAQATRPCKLFPPSPPTANLPAASQQSPHRLFEPDDEDEAFCL